MITKKIEIRTPFIKMDQLLKFADISGSGGEASFLISEGFISIDGMVESQRGKKIRPGMAVKCSIPGNDEILIIVESKEASSKI